MPKFKDLTGLRFNKLIAKRIIDKNKQGGYVWNLTLDQFEQLTKSNCFYCHREPSNITKNYRFPYIYNGIDRIDNNLGYEYSNCVPCCKICNIMKRDNTVPEFLSQIEAIYNKSCKPK